MRNTDSFDKTIIFCVDQEHADEMRQAINNLCPDLSRLYPDYVVRVVSDEGDIGKGYLSRFSRISNNYSYDSNNIKITYDRCRCSGHCKISSSHA